MLQYLRPAIFNLDRDSATRTKPAVLIYTLCGADPSHSQHTTTNFSILEFLQNDNRYPRSSIAGMAQNAIIFNLALSSSLAHRHRHRRRQSILIQILDLTFNLVYYCTPKGFLGILRGVARDRHDTSEYRYDLGIANY
jgi:hypothetical protein